MMDEGSFWKTTNGREEAGGKRWGSVDENGDVNNEGPR